MALSTIEALFLSSGIACLYMGLRLFELKWSNERLRANNKQLRKEKKK